MWLFCIGVCRVFAERDGKRQNKEAFAHVHRGYAFHHISSSGRKLPGIAHAVSLEDG